VSDPRGRGAAEADHVERPELSAEPSLVSLRAIAKSFASGTTALADLDLDVRAGEFLSLLGPSGCGKSTVLRLIAGLTAPSSGRIVWGDGDAERPEIGFVFQEPTLTPWSNVFANVWLPLRLRGVPRKQAKSRIEEALELVGLENFARALPRELSGGMKMRVSIARALVLRPSLLLMDEPFAALDEITRFRLNDDLLRLKRSLAATVVFVTHSVYESVYLSTRIAVFAARPGRIVKTIAVDPRIPRDQDFRVSEPYAALCREASQVLEDVTTPEGRR
jgi:NitT/TauT family transport system ATP-binding protein